ncbi:MAG TPA: threonine ammonia-lyase, biosynthetic [Steroidobacteraceae bacterium]|nr:threonine ammonia-lyase, biosynthetic [Steroidobacteraceae bacterium]
MTNPYIERILKARVYDVAIESPLEAAPRLSRRLGNQVLLKREDLQSVFSFKLRGAYNKIAHLSESAARRGVICASAGNHAQGVALAAQRRGVPATIVMPLTTPQIKVQAVMDLGGEVVLHGDGYDAAFDKAQELVRERNLVYVHAFDDPDVIAGQGTIAVELLRQCGGDVDAVFVPVGGGGLIAGIAVYIKYLYPRVRVVGVEPTDANAMYESLQAGKRVILERVGLFADGVAVKRVGEENFALARQFVDEVVLVNTDEMCAAIQDIFEETRTIVEPSGALAVAGIRKCVARDGWRDKRLVAINSGANVNFDRLRHIAERASLGGEREALFAVEIPEQPGSFLRFCEMLGSRNVTEFNYRFDGTPRAQIFAGFSLGNGRVEKDAVLRQLRDAGYPVHDMSDSELAKQHVRFMVGGHVRELTDEVIYRFEFPERPGALLKFLQAVGTRWNITMFHYRNHGSDNGRVLAGIQVPKAERAEFTRHLNALHYPYTEESGNPAYKMFLGT